MLRRRYRVEGRVQRVGFRWFTAAAARRAGLVGWVKNLGDGSVLCEAEGAADSLDDLGANLERGPAFARVDRVRVETLPALGAENDFAIAE